MSDVYRAQRLPRTNVSRLMSDNAAKKDMVDMEKVSSRQGRINYEL